MIDILKKQMETINNDGFLINSVEIDDPTDVKLHKGAYPTAIAVVVFSRSLTELYNNHNNTNDYPKSKQP